MEQDYSDSFISISLKENIVHVNLNAEYINDTQIIDNAIRKRLEIQNNKSYPMIADIRKLKGGNFQIRKRLTQEDAQDKITALAFVASSKFHVSLFNFFNISKFVRMPYRLFDTFEKAYEWIQTYANLNSAENNPEPIELLNDFSFQNDKFSLKIQDGIFYVQWICENYTESDIDFLIRKKNQILNGVFLPLYTDLSKVKSGSRGAYRRMSEFDAYIGVIASAVVCRSNVQISLYKMYHALYRPKVPNRFFLKEENALAWLQKFKNT